MGEEMAVHAGRSRLPVRVLLAAGAVALAAAGCASEGVTPGQTVSTGALGSLTGSVAGSPSASGSASGSASTPDSGLDSSSGSSGSSDSSSDADTSTGLPDADTSTSANPPGAVYKLTDTVTEGGFKLKIHSATMPYNPPAANLFTPAPTRVWLLLDFEVTNVSDQQSMFSTIGAFDVRDSANASYLTSITADDELPPGKAFQDKEMKPGETASGELVFDLSQKASGYRIIFKGNLWHASEHPPSISLGH